MKNAVCLLGALLSALVSTAGVEWYAVDPMSETQYLPDVVPDDGVKGGAVKIVAAKDEYEPGSFVIRADADIGKVTLEVGDLKQVKVKGEEGNAEAVFPKENLDLKTVKVWYQSGNAWFSYFADKGAKLCPELLLNDEDLIRVDEAKKSNYARLTEKDGRVHEVWLNNPEAFQARVEDLRLNGVPDGAFCSMKENFMDAPKHCGVTLEKNRSKQFFLTAKVEKGQPAGLYRGEVKVRGEGEQWKIPVVLRVLDFELPEPMCWDDVNKPFLTFFCDYTNLGMIRKQNGNDAALAEKQLIAICRDFAAHGQTIPSFGGALGRPDIVKAGGQHYDPNMENGAMQLSDPCVMRAAARVARRKADRLYGRESRPVLGFGDEYGLWLLKKIRPMVEIYEQMGFKLNVNSASGYSAGAATSDMFWPPVTPDSESATYAAKFNAVTGGEGYFGWYAQQHVGVENPAFCRRQYGFGPYRAGLSCNYNYAHHLDGYNDSVDDLYRPMQFVYGSGSGCIDTLQWEGFREGLDDIRYATLLKRLALPHLNDVDTKSRYAARLALQLLVDADRDDFDLTTLRLEMIRHIERLRALNATRDK